MIDTFISPKELYLIWNKKVGLNAIYQKINSGEIKSLPVGRKRLVPYSEVTEYVKRMTA